MAMTITDIRQEYTKKALTPQECLEDPVEQFDIWLREAITAKVLEPTAMHIATVSPQGRPSGRIVLLKGIEQGKFQFYTNYASRKGEHLAQNPSAALTFFWPELERQVRIEGQVHILPPEVSDAYFKSRPYASQLSAVTSEQSRVLASKEVLLKQLAKLKIKYPSDIPRPAHWGGYAVSPNLIEFWQGRPNRLHDRVMYTMLENNLWQKICLAP